MRLTAGLVRPIRDLARALTTLARNPGDRAAHRTTVERVLRVVRESAAGAPPTEPTLAAFIGVRWVARNALMLPGVDSQQAVDAVDEGTGEFDIPTPSPTPRVPFVSHSAARE
jgi:hypothetical protein